MDHEAVAVAVDLGGRVRLELDGDVRRGRVELEAGPRAAVLTQNLGRQVVSIVEGHHVILPYVEPGESGTQLLFAGHTVRRLYCLQAILFAGRYIKHVDENCQYFCYKLIVFLL